MQALTAHREPSAGPCVPQLAPVREAVDTALRAVAALLAALALHLGGGPPAAQASVAEDALLQLVRQFEARVDSTLGAIKDAAAQVSCWSC